MNTDGSGLINLTNNPANDNCPSWSPNGTKIAFATTRDSNLEIYVMNANGSGLINLTENPADDFRPAWSRDRNPAAFGGRGLRTRASVERAPVPGPSRRLGFAETCWAA